VGLPQTILDLENRSLGSHGEPTLGPALQLAVIEWRLGNRDRELRLHLLFLSWYCNLEPPHITGFVERAVSSADLPTIFAEVYETIAAGILDDSECLYVVGLVATLSPSLLGGADAETWEREVVSFRHVIANSCPMACRVPIRRPRSLWRLLLFASHRARRLLIAAPLSNPPSQRTASVAVLPRASAAERQYRQALPGISMAIPELEKERAFRALRRLCDKVPLEIRHQLTHDFRVVRSDIEFFSRRPHYQNRKREIESVIAKFRYNARRGAWALLWSDRNLRWHTYEGFEERRDFLELLREVQRDPTGIFFG
jgi:hypothetical protein